MSKPIKVLLIPEHFPTDQHPVAGIFMQDQIKALTAKTALTVWNVNPWYRGMYIENQSAQYFDFHLFNRKWPKPFNLLAYYWWQHEALKLAYKLPKADIIHLHGSVIRGGLALSLAAYWKVPIVITEHTGPWSAVSSRKTILNRAKNALEHADAILPVSRHLASEILESGISAKRVEVLGNPVDTDFFKLRKNSLKGEKRILFLGRLDPFKGALRTLQAFILAMADLPDFELELIGEGVEAEVIQSAIDQHGLRDRIHFTNRSLSRSEMRSAFHRASFLVFPSLFESFGLVAAEAMSTGLPVILTNRTGPRDFYHPSAALAVDPENIGELADAMRKMANEIDHFHPEIIRQYIISHFGASQYGNRLIELYASLISAKFTD